MVPQCPDVCRFFTEALSHAFIVHEKCHLINVLID